MSRQYSTKNSFMQWGKALFFVALIMFAFIGTANASDTTGIAELDDKALNFQNGLKVFAKWGGIGLIVITGVIIGTGKAQGQVATYLCYAAIALGLITAAFGWFSTGFTQGFVF